MVELDAFVQLCNFEVTQDVFANTYESLSHRLCARTKANLGYKLHIVKNEKAEDWSNSQTRLRFTVVNSEKGKNYPLNFVCLLPMRFTFKEDRLTMFEKLFGANSVEMAKKLLNDALETEQEGDLKDEIDRRLRLLTPELTHQYTCPSCGKSFQASSRKSWKRSYCEACSRKRFGYRSYLK